VSLICGYEFLISGDDNPLGGDLVLTDYKYALTWVIRVHGV